MTNEQEKKEEGSTPAAAADDKKDAAVDPTSSGLFTVDFTKLHPLPDDTYGRPCSRSSHGVSVVSHKQMIVVMGGEHIARTPLNPDQFVWIAEKTKQDGDDTVWKWRNIRPPPKEDNSDTKPSWPPMRVAHAQACIDDDIYIFGGRAGIDMSERAMNDLWKCHIPSETWTLIEPASEAVPEARSFHRMVVHNGQKLFVFGGCGSKGRLNDLHEFDIHSSKWINHGSSKILAGRGGPNVLPFRGGSFENNNFEPYIAVVAGFKGEESNDGHICRRSKKDDGDDGDNDALSHDWIWDTEGMTKEEQLINLRPRSVCISGTFPKCNLGIIFGGEVNPSDRGHEGAGGFANDIILLDGNQNANIIQQISSDNKDKPWPEARGWSAGDTLENSTSKQLYFFGGLTGDDTNSKRLDDLWLCEIEETKEETK